MRKNIGLGKFRLHLKWLHTQANKAEAEVKMLREVVRKFEESIPYTEQYIENIIDVNIRKGVEQSEKEVRKVETELKRRDKRIAELEKKLLRYEEAPMVADQVALARAKTFAIVDSILFAIENWAEDDSPAPDITLASQATLFPVLLNKVSQGDEDYYLEEVPMGAYEVVRRGRSFVKSFRDDEHISILNEDGWAVLQPILHSWWTRDAMPLLFDAGYAGWEKEEPFTRDQMFTWRDKEMSRAMDFPLIFDGFELVKKYGDQIRTETGLPEFNRQVMTTRIKNYE